MGTIKKCRWVLGAESAKPDPFMVEGHFLQKIGIDTRGGVWYTCSSKLNFLAHISILRYANIVL